jgi:hypothetical protein
MAPKSTAKAHERPANEKGAAAATYSDGHPLDEVHYREYKIILKPDRFTTPRGFHDFAKLIRHAASELDVALYSDHRDAEPQIREVVFYDTGKFDLYNHAFILRRRSLFRSGFETQHPELVLKFRHPDMELAAEVDVRPVDSPHYEIKFKEELLPMRNGLGGMRSLFSHNCVLSLVAGDVDEPLRHAVSLFPALRRVGISVRKQLDLVNHVTVEEVLSDLGELNFGHGLHAKANVAVWRNRGTLAPLCGEFAFQCKFRRYDELHKKARHRADEFFRLAQSTASEWVSLDTTKTGIVYGLGGHSISNHE